MKRFSRMLARVGVVLLAFSLPAQAQVTNQPAPGGQRPGVPSPPRDRATAAPTGTARLRGRVVNSQGEPLLRAQVSITAAEQQLRRTLTTDRDGRWDATALPAGRYTIAVSK